MATTRSPQAQVLTVITDGSDGKGKAWRRAHARKDARAAEDLAVEQLRSRGAVIEHEIEPGLLRRLCREPAKAWVNAPEGSTFTVNLDGGFA